MENLASLSTQTMAHRDSPLGFALVMKLWSEALSRRCGEGADGVIRYSNDTQTDIWSGKLCRQELS